jgi:hypothetical protein
MSEMVNPRGHQRRPVHRADPPATRVQSEPP